MKSIRESTIFGSNQRLAERKSIVGAFNAFDRNIFRDKLWLPHEEMAQCVEMYNRNSFAQSAINTMKDFIKGGDIVVKSDDKQTKIMAQQYLDNLDVDSWVEEVIENTIKTGNGYLEIDFEDAAWKFPHKCYAIADSSRIYINSDEFGKPKKEEKWVVDPITKEPVMQEVSNEEEYFIQRIEAGFQHPKAKWYDMSYHVGFQFQKFRIYGIPINKRKMIHFKLNLGDTGIYGRSYLASALDDYESLKQIERSIAIIAKYKAVPRDVIMYGDKDNPATDDELDEFIVYLESLEKEESAVVNKPIKRESLSYAGQDINLDYMIQHIRKKIIAGIAPDFMMGMSGDVQNSSAQITLLSYILAIYAKRKLFLRPIQRHILKPFLRKNKLAHAWLEFGELDFETKNEKANRVGALWVQNLLTFNEARSMLGFTSIGDNGDVYYLEWQSSMMDGNQGMGGFGFPEMPAPTGEMESLPNGEPDNKVFSHNPAPNRKKLQDGGKAPFDPYQQPTFVPKFLPKDDLKKPGEQYRQTTELLKKDRVLTNNEVSKLYDLKIPKDYNLESNRDYNNLNESITIIIDDDSKKSPENILQKEISYDTLMHDFGTIFMEPRQTEVYYAEINNGFKISFYKNGIMIYCNVHYSDIINSIVDDDKTPTEEEMVGIVEDWKNRYLQKAIKEE